MTQKQESLEISFAHGEERNMKKGKHFVPTQLSGHISVAKVNY